VGLYLATVMVTVMVVVIMPISIITAVTIPIVTFPTPTPVVPRTDGISRMGIIPPTPTPIVRGAILSMSQVGQARNNHERQKPSESSHNLISDQW